MTDLLHAIRETTTIDQQPIDAGHRVRPGRPTRLAVFLAAAASVVVIAFGFAVEGGDDPARTADTPPATFVSIAPSDPAGISSADG